MLKYNHVNSALCNFCLASSQGCPSDIHPWMFRSAFLLAQGTGKSLIPSLMDRMFLLYSGLDVMELVFTEKVVEQ